MNSSGKIKVIFLKIYTFRGVLFENRPALYFSNYKENYKLIHVCWIPQIDDFLFIMEQYIFNIRMIIIIIGIKKNKQYL